MRSWTTRRRGRATRTCTSPVRRWTSKLGLSRRTRLKDGGLTMKGGSLASAGAAAAVGLLVTALMFIAGQCAGQEGNCCPKCGHANCFRKVCRVVTEMKKEKKTEYSVKCEDFCLPAMGKCVCCEWVRDSDCCCCLGYRRVTKWEPCCSDDIICKKTLVKTTK